MNVYHARRYGELSVGVHAMSVPRLVRVVNMKAISEDMVFIPGRHSCINEVQSLREESKGRRARGADTAKP